ncbi:MAG: hypothetical protein KBF80_00460 [Flavobacteriales bacterium]|nr:hypothetical protein [Flavobacteriales bacterium]
MPPAPQTNPLRQLFADHVAQATQHYTINTDNGPAFVQGAHGLLATFGQHAFRKADGSTATGPVDIALVEALNVGDMLWLNKQTVGLGNGQMSLLVSGGQFRLAATQNGEALTLAPGGSHIQVPASGTPDPQMALFSGTEQGDGTMLWNPWATNPLAPGAIDSSGYYSFPNDSLGWINCDYFYGGPEPLTVVQVTCPPTCDHANTFVWLVFPAINSITNLGGGTGHVFATNAGYMLPVGLAITVVALAEIDGAYYSSFTDAVVADGMNLPISMQATTLEQFAVDAGGL